MFYYIISTLLLLNAVFLEASDQTKTSRFISSEEWRSDTKTPEANTPMSGTNSCSLEKAESFQKGRARMQNCVFNARKSLMKSPNKNSDHQYFSNFIPTAETDESSDSREGSKKSYPGLRLSRPTTFLDDEDIETEAPTNQTTSRPQLAQRENSNFFEKSPSKLQNAILKVKERVHVSQKRLSESMRKKSTDSSGLEKDSMEKQDDSNSYSFLSISSPMLSTTTTVLSLAAANAALNSIQQQPQRRSMLSAGDIFGAGATASSLSWIATLIASGVAISQIKDWLHSSCRSEKSVLLAEFTKKLQDHRLETQRDMNTLVDQMNEAIAKHQEETNETMTHVIEALEETSLLLENPENNIGVQNPHTPADILKHAAQKGKQDIAAQSGKGNPLKNLPALKKKTKCSSCFCCGSDND